MSNNKVNSYLKTKALKISRKSDFEGAYDVNLNEKVDIEYDLQIGMGNFI